VTDPTWFRVELAGLVVISVIVGLFVVTLIFGPIFGGGPDEPVFAPPGQPVEDVGGERR
jgi:hypothetical protein